MLRVGIEQGLDDGGFGGLVHLADVIVVALARDGERVEIAGGAVDDAAGAACGLDRDSEHGMHV